MANIETQSFELPSGATIEFEMVPEEPENTYRGGASNNAKDKSAEVSIPFDTVMRPLGEVADLVFGALKSSVKAPDNIEVELGAAIKGQTRLLIVGGDVQATIKVKLSWSNPR